MKDITPFLHNSTIKPELAHVYVHNGYAVATDSFRLIEIKLDDFCTENIPNGYYTAQKWKAMYKAYSKKNKDLYAFMVAIQENNLNADSRKGYNYPEWKAIVPNEKDLKPFNGSMNFNTDYLIGFIEAVSTGLPHRSFKFTEIQTNGKMLYYKNDTIQVFLMKLND